ncbi:class I SAM-dependent methyltransferase, partial [Sphingomonas adhaesiva]|uniref:class I SAM-dependent methyltransferase n=1 Tax=Sphingomonas adhaesiva TaxID=28212 RepID=UPI0035C78361
TTPAIRQHIRFLLNGQEVELTEVRADETLLDYLRLRRALIGTKEGCAEGDCGACTVLVGRLSGGELIYEGVNACIRFLASLDGCHIVTVEHLKRPDGSLHPVQQALRKVWRALKRRQQSNKVGEAAANVSSHYDHPRAFYELWLDATMSYSCAYFATPDMALKDAQIAKMRHIAAKLQIEPGMTVAEIGSGWGGLATYLAAVCGAKVTAINVSPDQLAASKERVAAAGVADRVTFFEKDYRELTGTFDRVVSVGMMEHVGVAHFDDYFSTVKRLCGP